MFNTEYIKIFFEKSVMFLSKSFSNILDSTGVSAIGR